MKVKVMAPICEGKMTLDLDFVDFCQFSNVFKVKGVFSNFFMIFWDFLDFWLVQPPSSDHLFHSTAGREDVRRKGAQVHLSFSKKSCPMTCWPI